MITLSDPREVGVVLVECRLKIWYFIESDLFAREESPPFVGRSLSEGFISTPRIFAPSVNV